MSLSDWLEWHFSNILEWVAGIWCGLLALFFLFLLVSAFGYCLNEDTTTFPFSIWHRDPGDIGDWGAGIAFMGIMIGLVASAGVAYFLIEDVWPW